MDELTGVTLTVKPFLIKNVHKNIRTVILYILYTAATKTRYNSTNAFLTMVHCPTQTAQNAHCPAAPYTIVTIERGLLLGGKDTRLSRVDSHSHLSLGAATTSE